MTDVAAAFADAGCVDVRTFIQSGNVLFDAPRADVEALRPRIASQLGKLLDAPPVVVFRTMRALENLVDEAPFGALVDDPEVKLYVAFLVGRPPSRPAFPRRLPTEALEATGMRGGDVLIVSRRKPNGMYGFPANWLEREIGVAATARNWSTVTKLVALARNGAITRSPSRAAR